MMRLGRASSLALLIGLALLLPGCSRGKTDVPHGHLVTFNPGSGNAYSVSLVPRTAPHLVGDLSIGLGHDGWNLSPERRYGLAYDTAGNLLTLIGFKDLGELRNLRVFLQVADFPFDGLEIAPLGRFVMLRQGDFEKFKILDFESLEGPAQSQSLVPSGTVRELLSCPDGRFGLFLFTSPADSVEVVEFGLLDDPLILFDLDTSGALRQLKFIADSPGDFVLIEEGTGRFHSLRFTSRTATHSLREGSIDLGDTSLSRVALFRQAARAVVGATSGQFFVVDFELFESPVFVSMFDIGVELGEFMLVLSPDDRFAAVGETSSGWIYLFNLELPEVPRLIGVFELGAPLTDLRFSADVSARDFRKAPSLVAVAGGNLSMIDLQDPFRPILGAGVGFSLSTYFTYSNRDRLLLSGVDSSGNVATFDLSDREQAVLLVSVELGLGGGLSRTAIVFR